MRKAVLVGYFLTVPERHMKANVMLRYILQRQPRSAYVYNQTCTLGIDRLFRPTSIARGQRSRTMLEGLYSRSMPQRTCLIVFQTYHTAEPCRSMYAQLAPYNMRKSPFVHKACYSIDHGAWPYRVAPAKLTPIKLMLVKLVAGVSKLCIAWLQFRPQCRCFIHDNELFTGL